MNSNPTQNNFAPYDLGDCIEFKKFLVSRDDNDRSNENIISGDSRNGNNDNISSGDRRDGNIICKGRIIDNSNKDLLEVEQINNDNDETTTIVWINPTSIINHYPKNLIPRLSVRLVLKDLWKDLIFREVKTVKTKEEYMITYQYVNDMGFVRSMKYNSYEEAINEVPIEYHDNIQIHYWDYFGFTTHRAIRNNDIYCNQEIFFSKKCYGELNLNNNHITGTFNQRRGFNNVPPQKKQYVCGLVEAGEKGLFYRKWFTCSPEFLVLWTMICEPEHHALRNNINGTYITKTLDEILVELDTSRYDVTTSNLSISDKQKKYRSSNVETQAIYLPNIYQRIAKRIFNPKSKSSSDGLYVSYEERFVSDLVWMKRFL